MSATLDPKKPVIDRFAEGGPLLVQAVAGLTPEQGRDHPIPGTWSVAELVSHLLDCDLVFADRMKRIIAEDSPKLEAFDEQAWITGLALERDARRRGRRPLRRQPEMDGADPEGSG